MHFANQALSTMVATVVWAVDIKAKLGEDGLPIVPLALDSIDKGAVMCVCARFDHRPDYVSDQRLQSICTCPMLDYSSIS